MLHIITKWEDIIENQPYNDLSPFLIRAREHAGRLCRKYNLSEDKEEKEKLKRELLKSCGKNVIIEPDFKCEFGCNILIGNEVYINFDCIILDCMPVTIGNNVLFGPRVGIYTANHSFDPMERKAGICIAKPITIEDNVWIGGDVKIVGGVTIGQNTVIGTGSVVTKDIPANVVAVGNPCRIIKNIV